MMTRSVRGSRRRPGTGTKIDFPGVRIEFLIYWTDAEHGPLFSLDAALPTRRRSLCARW